VNALRFTFLLPLRSIKIKKGGRIPRANNIMKICSLIDSLIVSTRISDEIKNNDTKQIIENAKIEMVIMFFFVFTNFN